MPCKLMGEGGLGKTLQGILALMTMATLAIKWKFDKTKRNRTQFLMDTFKNCSGAASLHVTNMFFSTLLAPVMQSADACQWYWTQIMIDTTFGVYIEGILLTKFIELLKTYGQLELAKDLSAHAAGHHQHEELEAPLMGEGGKSDTAMPSNKDINWRDINWRSYFKQVFVWLVVVQAMKAIMVLIMIVEAPQLESIAETILNPLQGNPPLELVIVMILTPSIMNSLQFWLQDNIFVLAATEAQAEALERRREENKKPKRMDDLEGLISQLSHRTQAALSLAEHKIVQLRAKQRIEGGSGFGVRNPFCGSQEKKEVEEPLREESELLKQMSDEVIDQIKQTEREKKTNEERLREERELLKQMEDQAKDLIKNTEREKKEVEEKLMHCMDRLKNECDNHFDLYVKEKEVRHGVEQTVISQAQELAQLKRSARFARGSGFGVRNMFCGLATRGAFDY